MRFEKPLDDQTATKPLKIPWALGVLAIVTMFSIVGCTISGARTIDASGLSLAAVQSAVDRASDGDLVVLPAGSATWPSPLYVSAGIELRGAGIGRTIITNPNTGWQQALIKVRASIGHPFRIDGFTFRGAGATASNNSDCIAVAGSVRGFRIDHDEFENGGAHSIWIWGDVYGLIDHDKFINPSQEVVSLFDKGTGADSWNAPLDLGGPKAVYVEDNTFDFETKGYHAITGVNGARYVFRYNTVTSAAALNASLVDMHGNYFDGRGGRSFEIYHNTFNSGGSYQGMYIRGGSGVIFDNTFTGSFSHPIVFTQYRAFETTYENEPVDTSCGYVSCTYPSPDQIHDVYVWNNTYERRRVVPYVDERGIVPQMIRLNRDYFLEPMPGYAPYPYPYPLEGALPSSGFSGSSG